MKIEQQRRANGQFSALSAAPIQRLAKRRGFAEFLDALVTRAPAFSTMQLGWSTHLPVIPGQPAPEISPGAGPEAFHLNLGFKAGTFRNFAEREGVRGLFAEFFGAKYFDKLQSCYQRALSAEADGILRRRQCRLAQELSRAEYENVKKDLRQLIFTDRSWPPTQLILGVFNEIAIRFLGNGAPLRLYDHVILWNTRNGCDEEAREFLERLGRAVRKQRPKQIFDKKDGAIMLFSADEMSCGIPALTRWRDEAGLGCVKCVCGDHSFSMDAYRDRFRKLGLSPESPKQVQGSFDGNALDIRWAKPLRNLVKSSTEKN